MSESCCTTTERGNESRCCPASGSLGQNVEWLTVAALTVEKVPPRQTFWLCRDEECEVVYFGEDGTRLSVKDLHVRPGFKSEGNEGLLCYCFSYCLRDIKDDLLKGNESPTVEHIEAEIQAGNCACEVRNPTGKCCLGEVKTAVRELQTEPVVKPVGD